MDTVSGDAVARIRLILSQWLEPGPIGPNLFTICLLPAGLPIKPGNGTTPNPGTCNLGQACPAPRAARAPGGLSANGKAAGTRQAALRLPISTCMPGPMVELTDTRLI